MQAQNWDIFKQIILADIKANKVNDQTSLPAVAAFHKDRIFDANSELDFGSAGTGRTRIHNHLFDDLSPRFTNYLPNNDDFEHLFDYFEYVLCLVFEDFNTSDLVYCNAPISRLAWRKRYFAPSISETVEHYISEQTLGWGPFRIGFWDNDWDRLVKAKQRVDTLIGTALKHYN